MQQGDWIRRPGKERRRGKRCDSGDVLISQEQGGSRAGMQGGRAGGRAGGPCAYVIYANSYPWDALLEIVHSYKTS
jgi:hypothetical protein